MAKKRHKARAKPKPKIIKVVLPPTGVVRVVAPPGVVPLVAARPGAVEIIPVKKEIVAKRPWWDIFGS